MKTKISRLLCMLLCAGMLCGMLPGRTLAAEEVVSIECVTVPEADVATSEELYEGYLGQLFYGSTATYGLSAREKLNTLGKKLYDFLKGKIQSVAAGESATAVFSVSDAEFTAWGAQTEFAADDISTAFGLFLSQFEMSRVLDALLHDCPYELYWFDKTIGMSQNGSFYVGDGTYAVARVNFSFAVVGDYQPSGYNANEPTFDQAKAASAVSAAANARAIVNANAGKGDYDKLLAYKNEICDLVSYNFSAAAGNTFSVDADPWQLVYVFDQDTSTNVVCEGYSKAFQYLCDESVFGTGTACYTVGGVMSGGTGAGGHMWNIVTIGGENYLVDVTNSDSGTVGQNGELFMAGTAGSVSGGYNFDGTVFTYGDDCMSLWGTGDDSILKLASANYDPSSAGEDEQIYVASGTCDDNLTWTLDKEGTLTISGSGRVNAGKVQPWADYIASIQKLVLSEGITSVEQPGFCFHDALTTVALPSTLTEIGKEAFAGCTALTQIDLPAGLKTIGSNAFNGCTALEEITLPASVTVVDSTVFGGCTSLTGIWVDSGNTAYASDGYGVLYTKDMTRLVKAPGRLQGDYEIPAGVTAMEWGAFDGCVEVTSIAIPEGVTYIDLQTFGNCASLKSVSIPNTVTEMEMYAFCNCPSLTSLTIPASVTYMGLLAIKDCGALTEIRFEGSAPCFDGEVFSGITATAYYPAGNETWTQDVMATFGGNITWVATCYGEHNVVIAEAAEPSCTEDGLTEGKRCADCGEVLQKQEIIPALGHKKEVDAAVAATCTESGLTEGTHCGTCGEVLVAQETVTALGHKEEVDAAVAATCTESGLTEGKHCGACGEVLVAQETVKALGHDYQDGVCKNCGMEAGEHGDLNGDGAVDDSDVAQLLWYTLFPDSFPITGDADFDGNGAVDDADVAYLLWHTLFPEMYPL